MKIGLISDDYHPRIDGVVRMIDLYRKYLSELGHEVYVICPKYDGYDYGDNILPLKSFDPLPLTKDKTKTINSFSSSNYRAVAELRLDIIHVQTQSFAFLLAKKISKNTKIPLITTFHTNFQELVDYYPYTTYLGTCVGLLTVPFALNHPSYVKYFFSHIIPSKRNTIYKLDRLAEIFAMAADHIIVISNMNEEFIKKLGSKTKTTLIRNGIETSKYYKKRKAKKPLKLIYASRLSSEKRHDVLIEAVAAVKNVELIVAGEGQEGQKLKKLVKELNISGRVTFKGFMPHEELIDLLSKCDIGVLASYKFDNNPLVIMEYLAAGLPVLYCDQNFSDMVTTNCSVLAEPSVDGLIAAISEFKTIDLGAYSVEAKKTAKKHDIKSQAQKLAQVYQDELDRVGV